MQSVFIRMSRPIHIVFFTVGAVLLFVFPTILRAQNSTSTLRGVVQDPSGGRVVGARVVVRLTGSPSRARQRQTIAGEFRIDGLLPGPYEVAVTAKGFADATADVDTAVSVVRDISITLKLGRRA